MVKILEFDFKDQDAIPRTPRVTLATTVALPTSVPICKKQKKHPSFLLHPSLPFRLRVLCSGVSLAKYIQLPAHNVLLRTALWRCMKKNPKPYKISTDEIRPPAQQCSEQL